VCSSDLPYAIQLGLSSTERTQRFQQKKHAIDEIVAYCNATSIKPSKINAYLEAIGTTPLHGGSKLSELINRPQITLEGIATECQGLQQILDTLQTDKEEIIEAAEVEIKYAGYIARERLIADKMQRLEAIRIKGRFDYNSITQLSTEARQKLTSIDPETLAQAGRIPGVSPSDISVLLVLLGR